MCASHTMSMTNLATLSSSLHSRNKWAEKEEWLRRVVARCSSVTFRKKGLWNLQFFPLGTASFSQGCLSHPGGHLRTLLSPRGYLVLTGGFETSFYTVGDKRFSFLPLEEKFLCEALQEVMS